MAKGGTERTCYQKSTFCRNKIEKSTVNPFGRLLKIRTLEWKPWVFIKNVLRLYHETLGLLPAGLFTSGGLLYFWRAYFRRAYCRRAFLGRDNLGEVSLKIRKSGQGWSNSFVSSWFIFHYKHTYKIHPNIFHTVRCAARNSPTPGPRNVSF